MPSLEAIAERSLNSRMIEQALGITERERSRWTKDTHSNIPRKRASAGLIQGLRKVSELRRRPRCRSA